MNFPFIEKLNEHLRKRQQSKTSQIKDASLFLVYGGRGGIKHQEVTDIACTCGLFVTPDPCGRRY